MAVRESCGRRLRSFMLLNYNNLTVSLVFGRFFSLSHTRIDSTSIISLGAWEGRAYMRDRMRKYW